MSLPKTTLQPGESVEAQQTITIEKYLLPGPIVNEAVATASDIDGNPCPPGWASSSVEIPGLKLIKEPDRSTAEVGETITYTYTITNEADKPLYDLVLNDKIQGELIEISLPKTTLSPGDSIEAKGTCQVKESDLPGPLINDARATASDIDGNPYNARATSSVEIPGLKLTKEPDNQTAKVGETVTYTYTLTNEGEKALMDLTLADFIKNAWVKIDLPKTTLQPGESVAAEETYEVTEDDLPGPLTDTATARASDSDGNQYVAQAKASVEIEPEIDNSIILLCDASSSMDEDNKIGNAKTAAKNFLWSLTNKDEVALIVFYDCGSIVVEQPFTTDRTLVALQIDDIQPSGNTPLKAAIRFAKDYMNQNAQGKTKKILQFTDGQETCEQ